MPVRAGTILALVLAALLPVAVLAQSVAFSGGTYTQTFDGLPAPVFNGTTYTPGVYAGTTDGPYSLSDTSWSTTSFTTTGMTGWQIYDTIAGGTAAGLNSNYGQGSAAAAISYGSDGSSERALGALAGSTRAMAFGVVFQNTSGMLIDSVTLAFEVEQWRLGRNNLGTDTLSFEYAVGTATNIATATFTPNATFNAVSQITSGTVGALNGNSNATGVSGSISLAWNPGDYLVLRWVDINDLAGNDHGVAMDNFSLTAIPEPSTYALLAGALALGWVAYRRRQRA
ncbi:MAG: PEP-CTERM sorting domain-containing protein [Candidatus Didemnitutus sp.]|nr:PEP-CTERM sorting domain-containing protein [Candidatus Didemnitutus sp.]